MLIYFLLKKQVLEMNNSMVLKSKNYVNFDIQANYEIFKEANESKKTVVFGGSQLKLHSSLGEQNFIKQISQYVFQHILTLDFSNSRNIQLIREIKIYYQSQAKPINMPPYFYKIKILKILLLA